MLRDLQCLRCNVYDHSTREKGGRREHSCTGINFYVLQEGSCYGRIRQSSSPLFWYRAPKTLTISWVMGISFVIHDSFWSYLFMLMKVTPGMALPCDGTSYKRTKWWEGCNFCSSPLTSQEGKHWQSSPIKPLEQWASDLLGWQEQSSAGRWHAWKGTDGCRLPCPHCPVHLFHLAIP